MPLTYDQISAITKKYYIPKLQDNIFDSDPLWARAKEKGWYTPVNGGTSIMQPLLYAVNAASGSYAPADTLDVSDNDIMTAAEYNWRYYYGNITITRADELKNNGDAAVLSLVKQKTQVAEMTMRDNLGDGLYSAGSSATDMGGLRLCVDSANTVGGISQSTYSWWQSQENSSTTTTTISAVQSMFNTLSINNKTPSVLMSTRAIFNYYYALLQPQQRFTDSKTASGGFQNLMFNGVPWIAGSKVPSGHLFLLNEDFMNIYYHPEENFRFEPFQKPINQNVRSGKVYFAGNFGISNARMHGKFTGLVA